MDNSTEKGRKVNVVPYAKRGIWSDVGKVGGHALNAAVRAPPDVDTVAWGEANGVHSMYNWSSPGKGHNPAEGRGQRTGCNLGNPA